MPRYTARLIKKGLYVINASADKIIDALHKLKGNDAWIDQVFVINMRYKFVQIICASIMYQIILAILVMFFLLLGVASLILLLLPVLLILLI